MVTNQDLVVKVNEFMEEVKRKNGLLAANVGTAILSMLEYERPLQYATRDQLLALKGIGPSNVDYLLRILRGEEAKSVVADVPTVRPYRGQYHERIGPESGNFDGSWDNSVRILEDK